MQHLKSITAFLSGISLFSLAGYAQSWCGPYLTTYAVTDSHNQVVAVHCLKYNTNTQISSSPSFACYGEASGGLWPYRHVGLAVFRPELGVYVGYAADIPGNGALANNAFLGGNIYMRFVGNWPPNQINVFDPATAPTPVWNQTWTRVDGHLNYTPLPKPSDCGMYFDKFEVYSLGDSEQGPAPGFRCVLRTTTTEPRAWIGFGNWGGTQYSHLGIAHIAPEKQNYRSSGVASGGAGAASYFCRPNELCQAVGNLWFQPHLEPDKQAPYYDGYDLTNVWFESWRKAP